MPNLNFGDFSHLRLLLAVLSLGLASSIAAQPDSMRADPYQWLEEIEGQKALQWVHEHNEVTAKRLAAHPNYSALYDDALAILNSESRIPEVAAHGKFLYNFWQDANHP